jgi:hypothetical protein
LNRREVVVHSRVLPGCEVASAFGCSPPVLPLCSPNTWPFRYSLPSPSPKTRLFGPSSPVVRVSYTVFPEVPAPDLSIEGTSHGVSCPFSAYGQRESTSFPVSRSGSPTISRRESTSRSHPAGYGAAHRFSQPLSGFFLSKPSCHFQTGCTPGVPPYRGLLLPRSPDDSSSPAYPPDVSPAGCAASVLGGGTLRHESLDPAKNPTLRL